jgi:hypothetical protein
VKGETDFEDVFRKVVEKRNDIAKRSKKAVVNQKEIVEYS